MAQSTPVSPGEGQQSWHPPWQSRGSRESRGSRAASFQAPAKQPEPGHLCRAPAASQLPWAPENAPAAPRGGFPDLAGARLLQAGMLLLPGTAAACLIALKAQQMAEGLQDVLFQRFGFLCSPFSETAPRREVGKSPARMGRADDLGDGEFKGIKTFAGLTLRRFLPAGIPAPAALPACTSSTCPPLPGDKSPFATSPGQLVAAAGCWGSPLGSGGCQGTSWLLPRDRGPATLRAQPWLCHHGPSTHQAPRDTGSPPP